MVSISYTHICLCTARLGLETAGCTTTTSLLELAALGADVWCRVTRSTSGPSTMTSPVTHRLAREAWTPKEHAVGASWVQLSELVEGDNLPACSQDTSTSSLGDTQSTDLETLRALEHTHIVGDSTNDHCHLPLLLAHELGELGERKWRSVVTAHEEALQNDFVEVGLSAASEETVKLHKKTNVH